MSKNVLKSIINYSKNRPFQKWSNTACLQTVPKLVWTSEKRLQSSLIDETQLDLKPQSSQTSSSVSKYSYRCTINDPLRHDTEHASKFYQIKTDELKLIDPDQQNLRKTFYSESKAFNEACLMIRKPALEVISYLKDLDLSLPAYRFILYGQYEGTGKRSTLFHLIHYCYRDNWLIINLPNCSSIFRYAAEQSQSTYKQDRWNTPVDALRFLNNFSKLNNKLLNTLNLKTTKTYNWEGKDSTPEGTPLISLFEYAKSKAKYASDICAVVIREIKLQTKDNNYKVLVAIDQMNSYFGPTRLKKIDKSDIQVDDITIVRSFKKLLKNDWNNAVVIGTINSLGVIIPAPNRRSKFYDMTIPWNLRRRIECKLHYEGPLTPAHLLKKEGFYYLEPFIPIEVPIYSNQEITNHYEYFKDRNWLQLKNVNEDEAKEELMFLSGRNPAEFARVCQSL